MKRIAIALVAGCVSTPTPSGISKDLDARLTMLRDSPSWAWKCEAVADARKACVAAGYDPKCYADGWHDRDHDAFTIAGCDERQRRGLDP